MFLILKVKRGYRYIRLVETIRKVCTPIVNSWLQSSVVLHDVLHGFIQGGRTGTAIIEAKLDQQIAGIVHEPLFQVFIDVRKAYNSLYRVRCMEILREYGLGPRLQKSIQCYWDRQRVVTKAGNYYGRPFSTGRGVTQGELVSPALFNIMVDSVFRATLQDICGPQEAQHYFGWSEGEHNICFYADDGRIAGRYPIWVQTALTTILRMFERVGLQTNLNKTKAMVCTPGFIWVQQGAESYNDKPPGTDQPFGKGR